MALTRVETGLGHQVHLGQLGHLWSRFVWVIRVRSALKIYPGLTQIGSHAMLNWEIYVATMRTYVLHDYTHFCNRSLVSASIWKPHPFLKIRPFTGLHKAMPINLLLFSPQECYPCNMLASCGNAVVQSTCIRPAHSHSHLFQARTGARKLAGSYIQHFTTHLPDRHYTC